jgi:hypothetical protein
VEERRVTLVNVDRAVQARQRLVEVADAIAQQAAKVSPVLGATA